MASNYTRKICSCLYMNRNSKLAKRNEEGKKQYSRIVCTKVDEVPGRRRRRGKWSCKLPKQQNMWGMWSNFIMRDYLQVLIGWLLRIWIIQQLYGVLLNITKFHAPPTTSLLWTSLLVAIWGILSSLYPLTSIAIPTSFSPIAIGSKLVSTCIGFKKFTLNASGFPVFLPNKKHLHLQPPVGPNTISAQGMKPGPTMEAVSNSWKPCQPCLFFPFKRFACSRSRPVPVECMVTGNRGWVTSNMLGGTGNMPCWGAHFQWWWWQSMPLMGLGNHGLGSMTIHIHFKLEHGFGGAYEGTVM